MFVVIRRQEAKDAFRNTPTVIHQTVDNASGEAARLARTNTDTNYDVFELVKVGSAIGTIEVSWVPEVKPKKRGKNGSK